LDRLVLLSPGNLIIIAARPGHGKTSFALDMMKTFSLDGKACMFFTMEMGAVELVTRQISSESGVPADKKTLTKNEAAAVTRAAGRLADAPQLIDETGSISAGEIRAKARAAHRRSPLSAIFIDYLQLMSTPGASSSASTNDKIASISSGLKSLARELGVPVVCLSQLNREPDKRTNHEPVVSDLRDSGAIEQDADLILFIYRDEVYYGTKSDKIGMAKIIVGKNRSGALGSVELSFTKECTRFKNLAKGLP